MATIAIREYAALAMSGAVQAGLEPAIADQSVASSGVTAQSAAFNVNSRFIAISTVAATGLSVLFGDNPTATTSHLRIPPNSMVFFGVRPGQKVAVIDN
jgi:hypothetical protein